MQARIDVALLTYNHGPYIRQAIESVLMQRVPVKVRLVVGDDCSTDGTREVVASFQRQYPDRVVALLPTYHRGLRHPDSVFGRLLAVCDAPYLALLEGDDYWTDPDKLLRQYRALERRPKASLAFHDVEILRAGQPSELLCGPQFPAVLRLSDFLSGRMVHMNSLLLRWRGASSLAWPVHQTTQADFNVIASNLRYGVGLYINSPMSVYRVHSTGVWSGSSVNNRFRSTMEAYRLVRDSIPEAPPAVLGVGVRGQVKHLIHHLPDNLPGADLLDLMTSMRTALREFPGESDATEDVRLLSPLCTRLLLRFSLGTEVTAEIGLGETVSSLAMTLLGPNRPVGVSIGRLWWELARRSPSTALRPWAWRSVGRHLFGKQAERV